MKKIIKLTLIIALCAIPFVSYASNNCVSGTMNYLADGSGQCSAYINSQLRTISFCTGSETSGPCRPERVEAEAAAVAAANQSLLTGQACVAQKVGFPGVDPNTALNYYYSVDCGNSGSGTGTGTGTTRTNLSSGEVLAAATYQRILDSVRVATERVLAQYQAYVRESLNLNLNISPSALIGIRSSSSTNTNTNPSTNQCYIFDRTIKTGDTGNDVLALTTALKQEGFISYTTSLFTAEVMTAVKRLQEKYATEILSILGLTQGTGVVGEKTRAYLNTRCIKLDTAGSTPSQSCVAPRSAIKNGKYQYTFTKVVGGNWTITLNNPAFRTPSDPYYVPANVSFSAPDARDLNRQNQGRFNYLVSLPGTPEGNTEYANLFGSFNNAYYDWDVMTKDVVCTTSAVPPPPASSSNQIRYIKISVADWDTLPLALREITVIGANNTTIRPVSISATDFDRVGYTPASNLIDGNENTVWRATKSAPTCARARDPVSGLLREDSIGGGRTCEVSGDLQVITLDLGTATAVDRVSIMNYGFTDTRVVVIEVSENGNSYTQIAEVRAQVNAPIADKGMIVGVVKATTTPPPPPPPPPPGTLWSGYAPFIGAYIWGSQVASTGGSNVISKSVNFAANKGFKVVRLTLSPRSLYDYGISSTCDSKTLAQIAASDAFKLALSNPSITTYMLTVYDATTFGDCTNKKYMNPEFTRNNSAGISQEYKDLAVYLYQTYKNTGKKFILLNWEGDNDLYCGEAYNYAVDKNFKTYCDSNYQSLYSGNDDVNDSILGMKQWIEARTSGINAGKIQAVASGVGGVSVDSAVEFNIVNILKNNGYKSVLFDVLPAVPYDYASYSAYESINQENPSIVLTQDIAKIKGQISNPIIIGEFGFDKDKRTLTEIQTHLQDIADVIKNTGLPYGIVWQLFDQQDSNFGLFDSSGTPESFNAFVTQ